MASKLQMMTAVYDEVSKEVRKNSANWMRFLQTAANNYKYRFKDQLMIYAQKPEATACAEIDTWNKLGRWVNKGTKGIALLVDRDTPYRLRHVFDISDTNSRAGVVVSLWKMNYRYEEAVSEALQNSFGEVEDTKSAAGILMTTADNIVADNYTDYYESLLSVKAGSFLEDLDNQNIELDFRKTLANSVAFMLLERCGYGAADFFSSEDFEAFYQFNTTETISVLGGATSDISEMVLREIEETVRIAARQEKSINRTFAKESEKDDNVVEKKTHERSDSNDSQLHETGGLSDSRPDSTAKPQRNWEVWNASPDLSQGTQGRDLYRDAPDGQTERASDGNRPSGDRDDGGVDSEVGEASGSEREAQGRGSVALGTADEQHPELGGGNGSKGAGIQLTYDYPTVEEQQIKIAEAETEKVSAFVISQDAIDGILTRGSGISEGKLRIFEQFQKKKLSDENITFLKNEYGIGGSYPAASVNDVKLSEDHDAKGIRITVGSLSNPDEKKLLSWAQVAKRIGELISADRYLSQAEKESYPKFLRDRELRAKRSEIDEEFRSIIRDFNDFETQLGNEDAVLNQYVLIDCGSQFTQGNKTTWTLSENNYILPLMRDAMNRIIAENTHLTERCQTMLKSLDGELARPMEPTFDELNPPPEPPKEYRFSLGDTVHIGIDKYEILSLGDTVVMFDETFPLFNKEMTRAEFEEKVAENPLNDKYLQVVADVPEVGSDDDRTEMPWDYGKHFADDLPEIPDYAPKTNYDDVFFVDRDRDEILWMYYNPDAVSGGQYVINHISTDHIRFASENRSDTDSFFDALGGYAKQELVDVGTPEFDEAAEQFLEKPSFTDCDGVTMIGLLEFAGISDKLPVYDRESEILYDILSELKIDDIELDFDRAGIVASDQDNIWHGAEFYRFLVDEAIVWNDDGTALGIGKELLYDFEELSEHMGVPLPKKKELTPWEEYSQIKARNPDTVVLYQMGDFFEVMGEDAIAASDALGLVLTNRTVGDNEKVPLVGVPSTKLDENTEMLRAAGYSVLLAPLEGGKRNEYIFLSTKEPEKVSVRVSIPFSEHPAFYSREKDENGEPKFVDRFTEMSFAAANALLGQLDMKQNAERETKSIGWYHKTDFVIHYSVDGIERTYEGRYDLGDGETDLLTHITKAIDYYEKFNEKGQNPEHAEEWGELRRSLLPLLAADTELSDDDRALVDEVMATEPEWYPDAEPAQQLLSDEELDELPISTVIDGEVKTFPNADALEDAINEPTLEPPKPKQNKKVALSILHPEISSSDRSNFRIDKDEIGVGTPSERYENNVSAIRLLKKLEAEERLATEDEQKTLSEYVGWGGLSDCFDEKSSHYLELKELLTEDEYASARESTLTAFYTPPVVIRAMYQALENMNFKVGNILEPSCGVGNFIGMLPESMNESKIYGVELDSISGRIAQQLYQKSSIAVEGFEKTNLPDSFFDASIGNVPFGQFKVPDKRYDKHNFLIHDYFFARTLDKVRPGGIIAFVTSKGTLDKENPAVRKYIAQRADLIGAVRLPNNTFKSAAGTEVTSDIIFLQKRDRMIDFEPDWVHLGTDENGVKMNQYFIDNPEMILGEMQMVSGPFGPESACVPYADQELPVLLSDAIQNIHAEVVEYEIDDLSDDEEDLSIPADPEVRNFSFTVVDGKVYYRENSRMNPMELSVTAENRIKGLVEIRDCVRRLIEYQTEDYPDADIKAEQEKLGTLYDKFSKKYGIINSRANSSAFSDDSAYCLLCSLEVLDDEGNFVRKADMFTKRTIRQRVSVTSVDTASEALSVSLSEKAKVDMPFMCELTGKTEQEIYADLQGVIFLNPMHTSDDDGRTKYLTADEYLSGNVREKLEWARRSAELYPEDYTTNVQALEAVQPTDLTASEISVRLGATWLPTEVVQNFMFELFETPRWCQWNVKVHFSEFSGEWNIEGKSYDRGNIKSNNTYGTNRVNGYKIIEDTLNLRDVRIFDYVEDENGKRTPVLNRKETAIAQGKQDLIRQAFADWIWNDPQRREMLCKLYNTKFNSNRAREYDGSFLNFVGMNPEITLRPHQINAISRILLGGNSLLAHVVGAGKTFEMVAAAQESKRLGLCQKSLFVVPNHLTEQWASEYLQLYPSANILVATKKDFEAKNRKKFCGRIATGDYDAVIIGHSQFEKIPMSIDRQRMIMERQLDEIINGIAELKKNHGDNFSVKQLEKSKKTIRQKLEKLNDQSRKDDVVTFEELGVDRIFIDEAHYYKNLAAFSKMRNVGGISQNEAMKSSDLYMKCRYLDELTDGKGVVFATGTPISNSMVEMYTMQKYLQYQALKENNLLHFDSWASTFGETVTAIELAPEGSGYRAKTRFAKFYNLPELIMMFREVADIQTADMLNLPVPKANYHTVALKPSEQQKDMVESLSKRAEKVRNKMVPSYEDNMLVITNDGRKLALDQRLINELLPDSETSKVGACAENVFDIWNRTEADSSTQMVFCDLSTPHGDDKFNVYDALRDLLIAKGIPTEKIAYIHDAKTETQKKEMFGKVRNGQIRVLIGSTQKMGAGTNVQKKLVALHHLDCPWRPADLQQREGRIIRQGNENPEVEIFSYVTEGTFDAYLYQLVESKQKFIGQIMTSKSPVRSADDVDEQALSYAEIKALASGNPHIKEKMDLDIEVARLKLLKANHLSQRYSLEDKILKDLPQKICSLEERIKGYDADIAHAAENTHPNEDGFSPMTIKGTVYYEKKAAGEAIIAVCKTMTNPDAIPLGEYRGFSMELAFDTFSKEYKITMKNQLRHTVALGTDVFGNILRLDNAISGFEEKQIFCREQLDTVKQQLASAKIEVEKPFPHEEDLKAKSKRLDELNILLNMDKLDNEIDDGERSEDDSKDERKSPDMER